MTKFPIEYAKALYERFSVIYNDKFIKSNHDEFFIKRWWDEWAEGLDGIDPYSIKEALSHCRIKLEWPPSIAEFRKICAKICGYPSIEQSLQAAIRREFNHPIVAIAYDNIGAWAMKHDKEEILRKKFSNAYDEAVQEFRANPKEAFLKLEAVKERTALPEPPPKIPTEGERISFKERYRQWQEMSKQQKSEATPADHPTWEKAKITRGHRNFNLVFFSERRKYLIDLDEDAAMSLTTEDKYDRIRFLRETERTQRAQPKNNVYEMPNKEKTPPWSCNSPKVVYKNWMND